jgi:uncharacterized tellurite resistance protein B-like protein
MLFSENYHNGLLYLAHLVISADGVIDENELKAMQTIKEKEGISDDVFSGYKADVKEMREKDIYQKAMDHISTCSDEERLRAFCWLYRISEVDGNVHVKEVRFLLYSVKRANVDFDDVVAATENFPHLL